ncbi:MAG: exopolysaccharide biosynthesis polyprenyl glycosylphosphotransferase [Frankiales bacterium]|nr:exopolysaccharide biosynthesis polyprenyl glycosylphosphotransferase [Frankiales bacterium]
MRDRGTGTPEKRRVKRSDFRGTTQRPFHTGAGASADDRLAELDGLPPSTGAPSSTETAPPRWHTTLLDGLRAKPIAPYLVVADLGSLGLVQIIMGRGVTAPHVLFVVVLLQLYRGGGLYRSRLTLSLLDDLPALLGRGLVAVAVASVLGTLPRLGGTSFTPPRGALVGVLLIVVARGAVYGLVVAGRSRLWIGHRALVVGAGTVGAQVVDVLREYPKYGLRPVGFLDSRPLLAPERRTVPVLGGLADLESVISYEGAQVVIISFGWSRDPEMVSLLRTCGKLDCELLFVPRLFELGVYGDLDHVRGIPLARLRRLALSPTARVVKRTVDVVVALISLAFLAPCLLLIAAAVRIETGPGVIFRQVRVGIDGKPFVLLKFRSMPRVDEHESATLWSVAHDRRIGPVGRAIRATSLDELPQLWNVLRGDMSLVGPRPERPHFVEQFARTYPQYMARHRVPSGLTGLAQVHGLRGDTPLEERVRFDNAYIESWSLWLDVKTLLRTIPQLASRAGS